ncbi:unnamed protein product [Pleuronectes platessa]|uniref:Uncharacterized protein n=1 Tax=Pleuronectes platessa TaxID=8262 RepID=A0A9N7YA13_PLEPL|nr:unnamed protein product [Pleuronectes platessa]
MRSEVLGVCGAAPHLLSSSRSITSARLFHVCSTAIRKQNKRQGAEKWERDEWSASDMDTQQESQDGHVRGRVTHMVHGDEREKDEGDIEINGREHRETIRARAPSGIGSCDCGLLSHALSSGE